MDKLKISLMEAYMIETLRSHGVTNKDLLSQMEKKEVMKWERIEPRFDFSDLIPLYEKNPNEFATILTEGYTVKFVTFKGLQNLLDMKFNKVEGRDFKLTENGIIQLNMDERESAELKQLLSPNWAVQQQAEQLISVMPTIG